MDKREGCGGGGMHRMGFAGATLVSFRAQKHRAGTKTAEGHILGLRRAGTCWDLSGGYQCQAGSAASSGLRTSRLVEGPGQSCTFRAQEGLEWESGLVPTPEWCGEQVWGAAELCAYAWLFGQDMGSNR